ncbi:MAG: sulfatase [Candidatus Krumholzibacteriia bacterium]
MRAWAGAGAWAFLLAAAVGALEAVGRGVLDAVAAGTFAAGTVAQETLAQVAVYGWTAAAMGWALFWPALLVGRTRPRPRRSTFAVAVAGAAAGLLVIYADHVARNHVWPGLWDEAGVGARILLTILWFALLLVLTSPADRLAGFIARRSDLFLVVPLALMAGSLWLYPDGETHARVERLAHLERRSGEAVGPDDARPHVVLVTVGDWRRDHLSAAAAASPPTPHLDGLAAEGVRFDRAYTASPATLPALAGIMTGWPARVTGVERVAPLPPAAATLAEVAWRHGYDTAAFVTGAHLLPFFDFDRGFLHFEHALRLEFLAPAARSVLVRQATRYAEENAGAEDAEYVVTKAIRWLEHRPGDAPFLLWVHLHDVRLPYRWRDLPAVTDAPATTAAGGRPPDRAETRPAGRLDDGEVTVEDLRAHRAGSWHPVQAERRAIAALYAREVQYADAWLGRLFTALRELRLWDRSIVIATADHGQELFDHGGFGHGHTLLPEVVGVPLLVKTARAGGPAAPSPSGTVRTEVVTTLAVLPTVAELAGWELPSGPGPLPHASLVPLLDAPAEPPQTPRPRRELMLLEGAVVGPPGFGVVDDSLYLIIASDPPDTTWIAPDDPLARAPLGAPPADTSGFAARVDAALAAMAGPREAMERSRHRAGAAGTDDVPAEVRRSLRSRGH